MFIGRRNDKYSVEKKKFGKLDKAKHDTLIGLFCMRMRGAESLDKKPEQLMQGIIGHRKTFEFYFKGKQLKVFKAGRQNYILYLNSWKVSLIICRYYLVP